MEVMLMFHMNKGTGEASYAKNSSVQSKIIFTGMPIIEEAVLKIICTNIPKSMAIADLGCSSGPNTFQVISQILDVIHSYCQELNIKSPEFRVFLNDLFSNDFNSIFMSLPAFYSKLNQEKGAGFGPCFVSSTPGSFYGRLFPSKSLHFVHSSSSLHWLSEVPSSFSNDFNKTLNKGKVYISKTSPQCILDAYALQFKKDFSTFIRSRSEEIVPSGRMVLSFMGRSSSDPTTEDSCYQWELLAKALMTMVPEGLVEESKVDSFNAPYYAPCREELELEIEEEGSFVIDRMEKFEIEWDGGAINLPFYVRGQMVAKAIRAVVEPMLETHFGRDILDTLFQRYGELVSDYLSEARAVYNNMVISLIRKD